jgi:spore coat protein CotH
MKKQILLFLSILAMAGSVQAQPFPDEMHMSADGRMLLLGDLPNTGLYDQALIRNVYLNFSQPDYWAQLDSNYWGWVKDEIPATMIVDGVTYDSVGVRFKGQSSFQQIQNSQKKSFGISLDYIHPNQDIMGRKTLNLNNCFQDPSFIREIFYQHLIKKHIPAAKSAYVRLFLNSEDWGLYVSVQQINKSFYKDWYLSAKGTNWRADRASGAVTPYGDGTGGLNFLGASAAAYQAEYMLKFTDKANPWDDLISTCDVLNTTPLANLPSLLPAKLDIDRTLWFLASEILFSDDDSYVQKGRMDYYAYWEMETGRMAPQEYDGNTVMNQQFVNWSPFYHEDSVNYPLMNRLFAIPEYRQRYLAHFRTLVKEYFTSSSADAIIDAYAAQINNLVLSDTKKLYTYADFQNEIPILKNFITVRRSFVNSNAEVAEAAPVISNVAWFVAGVPWITPGISQPATVRAGASHASGIYQMNMYYSNALVGNFTKAQMFDDGMHDDVAAGDGIYGATLPGQAWGSWTRFYVEAVAANSAKSVSYEPAGAEHNVYAYQIGGVGAPEISAPATFISVFPNPASNHVEIEADDNSEHELIVVNAMGQLMHKEKFMGQAHINVRGLPAGLYFVQCGDTNKKLMVTH